MSDMSKQKGLEEIIEKHNHEIDKSKSHKEDLELAYENKTSKVNSKGQSKPKDDPPGSKKEIPSSILGSLNSTATKTVLQATLQDNTLSGAIIQSLGLCKVKGDVFKSFTEMYRITSEPYGSGNVISTIQGGDGSNYARRRYDNKFASVHNMLAYIQMALYNADTNADSSRDFVHVMCAHEDNGQQEFLRDLFMVATEDGGGDSDPYHTKQMVGSLPLGGSCLSAKFPRYLVELLMTKDGREIHSKLLTKEDNTIDFSKAIKSPLDKLSWQQEYEEVIHTVLSYFFIFIAL